jgi:hypothetical protein
MWDDGTYHSLPQDYVFPKGAVVSTIAEMWFIGSTEPSRPLPPFRFLKGTDFMHVGSRGGKRFSDLKNFMKSVEAKMVEANLFRENWTLVSLRDAINALQDSLVPASARERRRLDQLSWDTMLKLINRDKRHYNRRGAAQQETTAGLGFVSTGESMDV